MLTASTSRALRSSATRLRGSLQAKRYGSHEAPHYNEPSGWLFGEKPPPPGQKRVKEDWENIWLIGMFGTMAFGGVMMYYKPDTSVQSWALKEAKERMEARGEKFQYEPSDSTPARS